MRSIFTTLLLCLQLAVFAQLEDELILYMPLDGDVLDYSGYGNHGTAVFLAPDTNRFGTENSSYRFDGTNSYIEIPASPTMNSIQSLDEITITAWININQWHVSGNVFSIFERYNPNTDSGWLFEANWAGGGIIFLADESSTTNWSGCNYSWNFHEWHHLGLTFSQAEQEARFYVDGVNICTNTYNSPINVADTTSSFIIGRSLAGPDEYSDGWIDDYRIYRRALVDEEINESFLLGSYEHGQKVEPTFYPNPANTLLNIGGLSQNEFSHYHIFDITGKSQLTGRVTGMNTQVDVSSLSKGIYFMSLEGKNKVVEKIVIAN